MAFTPTTLATTPLLETTFISDMRIIVNANTTLLKSKIEDTINELQIDIVNKYIGVDLPIGKLYTQDLVVSNQIVFKSGTSGSANTIASLTQSSGISTLLSNNLQFTKALTATATGSIAAVPTVVVGTTTGGLALDYPRVGTSTVAQKGLYVGSTTTPIKAGFYGEVQVINQAITHSSNAATPRVINLVAGAGALYSYGILALSKTDPQFIHVNLVVPSGYTQAANYPIWLQLHDDYTTSDSRPAIGQSFTIVINQILDSGGLTALAKNSWPQVLASSDTAGSLGIMPGYIASTSAGAGNYKIGYINDSLWTSVPSTGTGGVAALGTGLSPKCFVRFFNPSMQTGTAGVGQSSSIRGASVTLTKSDERPTYSYYTITGSSNVVIVNS